MLKNSAVKLLFVLLAIGSFTGAVEISRGIYNPHKTRPPRSAPDFAGYSYQFLGSKDSVFYKYLAK